MRVFEIILVIAAVGAAIAALRPRDARAAFPTRLVVAGVLLLALALHLLLEGARWQMYPVYGIALLLTIAAFAGGLAGPRRVLRIAAVALACLCISLGAGLAFALPVPRLPQIDKPLGTFTLYLTDESRQEQYAPTPADRANSRPRCGIRRMPPASQAKRRSPGRAR